MSFLLHVDTKDIDHILLISFFSLHELFPAFINANNTGSLVNSLFVVNMFNCFPSFTYSALSSGDATSNSSSSLFTI